MTDNEILLALSKLLEPVRADIQEIKESIDAKLLKSEKRMDQKLQSLEERMDQKLQSLEERMDQKLQSLEERMDQKLQSLETKMDNKFETLDCRLKKIELTQENDILPRLRTIESCYVSTFDRYRKSVEDYDRIKQDVSILKEVVTEHSKKLQMIS